jgi:hypothetical protein
MLLREVLVNDKQINLPKLVEVIDICNFFPIKVKKIKNKSNDIYQVLSSNTRDTYNAKEASNGGIESELASNLEIIWGMIHQKFKNVAKAFHFFDMDDNRSIDFIEFFSGLDKLRIKISEADALFPSTITANGISKSIGSFLLRYSKLYLVFFDLVVTSAVRINRF